MDELVNLFDLINYLLIVFIAPIFIILFILIVIMPSSWFCKLFDHNIDIRHAMLGNDNTDLESARVTVFCRNCDKKLFVGNGNEYWEYCKENTEKVNENEI